MNKWNKQRKRVTKRRDELQNELLSNETSKNDEDIQTLLKSLNETLNTMQQIEESNQVYRLKVSVLVKEQLLKAYPWLHENFYRLHENFKIINMPNIHYKKN